MPKRLRAQTKIADRKARRKEERKAKKKKANIISSKETEKVVEEQSRIKNTKDSKKVSLKQKQKIIADKKKKSVIDRPKKKQKKDLFDFLDEETAVAIRKDDAEIAFLEKNLGLAKGAKDKKKLHKEYAKLEGYGDDFGDFLDGLDDMLEKIAGGGAPDIDDDDDNDDDSYDYFKKYGDTPTDMNDSDSDMSEEIIPMKSDPDDDDDDSGDDSGDDSDDDLELESLNGTSSGGIKNNEQINDDEEINDKNNNNRDEKNSQSSDSDSNDSESGSDSDSFEEEKDHDEEDTYKPVDGQDLYGNVIDSSDLASDQPKKYIPPHLRRKQSQEDSPTSSNILKTENDPERKENLRSLARLLNNSFNRLAENTIESVAKSISSIYNSNEYSSRDTNDGMWKNLKVACVVEHMIRESLIPLYISCISGLHFQMGDAVQLGSDIVERSVMAFWDELQKQRNPESSEGINKQCANYLLILCYFYNYGVVHCTLIYDLVRKFIDSFTELDVELLLLILSHCGQQLRSDDPTALKDIVILVQKRSLELMNDDEDNGKCSSSRAQFMLTTMTDLKNNKRKPKDLAIAQKTSEYRKVIGRMKSTVNSSKGGKNSSSSFKFTLQDILDIETKGRWWVLGSRWTGHKRNDEASKKSKDSNSTILLDDIDDSKQKKLLKLAAAQRMNTDLRRSIFCIIMGSDDCQDAFEKLVRNRFLKGMNEREVVRVIVHCCGTEKVYNPYYAHLANRICEFQTNCIFTFKLTFWDSFKQFESMKSRKAANLAKLLAHLMLNNRLNLTTLKIIDISPDNMSEASIIFLTILFTNILETCEDASQVSMLFKRGQASLERSYNENAGPDNDNLVEEHNDRVALKENLNIFFLHFLQASPKNEKGSKFRKHLKAAVKACSSDGFDSLF